MTKKLPEKLRQEKHRQSKNAKTCVSIRWEYECEKCSKTSAKYLSDKISKIKQIQNNSVNLKTFLRLL